MRILDLPAAALLACLVAGCAVNPAEPPAPTPPASASPTPPSWRLQDLVPGLQQAPGPAAPHDRKPRPSPAVALGPAALSPGTSRQAARWSSSNVGLSFEATELADPRWEPTGSPLTPMLRALHGPSLRFGGNRVDRSMWWTSSGEPAPRWASSTVTPADLQRLARMARAVDATVTLVLDLGHRDPQRAADMAAHARRALGSRLVAVSIGNEPNGYHHPSQPQLQLRDASWSPQAYVREARGYEAAVHRRSPGLPIAGPGAYDAQWWRAFAQARLPHTVALTQHWYPLWSCPGRTGTADPQATPTVANLTSPQLHERSARIFGAAAATAAAHRLPLWLEETGPVSCNGSPVSATHAHALWSVDHLAHAAVHGIRRANMHSTLAACGRGNPMSMVCTTSDAARPLRGQAAFQSMLLLAQLRPGSITEVATGDPRVTGYLVRDAHGADLVLVNLHDPATTGPAALSLRPPKGWRVRGTASLQGDDLASRTATTSSLLAPAATAPARLAAGQVLLVRMDR